MSEKEKNNSVIAICIQEPSEDGSNMDFGEIKGDDLRFIHQAFITDSICSALSVPSADTRLYYIEKPDRKRLVDIVTEYLGKKKCSGDLSKRFQEDFSTHSMEFERWGIRMEKIFEDCFAQGYKNVLLIGSRTPTITSTKIKAALRMLEQSDAVFGPTPDGRYYSIGMSGSYRIKLSDFDWKSGAIYSEVAGAFTEQGLSWSELEIWYAVESAEELELMARDINQFRFEGDETSGRETELVMERLISKLEQ